MFAFFRYFLKFTLHSKTKQPLLFIAVFGLTLSSFALLFLQGAMGGMQSKQVERSKAVTGTAIISFFPRDEKEVSSITTYLDREKISWRKELVLELLIKNGESFSPLVIHGLEQGKLISGLNQEMEEGLVVGFDLSLKIGVSTYDQVRLINPARIDNFMGAIPKMATLRIDDVITTQVPEVDSLMGWAPLGRVQGLIDERAINTIRVFSALNEQHQRKLNALMKNDGEIRLVMWDEVNETLVKALKLETTMMIFLFSCMSLLVALSITSGLMLFFDKMKRDFVSFWIQGVDEKTLYSMINNFLITVIILSILCGLALSSLSLFVLDHYGPSIMPAIFVDQKIPVQYSVSMYAVSFLIPLSISLVFSCFALSTFKKDVNYLDYVRAL